MSVSNIEIKEYFIDGVKGKIFVKEWNPKKVSDHLPIILLHDLLGSVGLWRDFPLMLAKTLSKRVIAYDRFGFGKSSKCTVPAQVNFISEEAHQYFPVIKKQLFVKNYLLLGHSVGGGISLNIAANDLECSGVITVSAQAFVEDNTIKGIQNAQVLFKDIVQVKRLEKWHGKKAQWVLSAWIDVWLSSEFKTWSLKDCIENIKCPVLAVHGDKDEYGSNAFPEFIVNNVAGYGEKVILEGCGHVPHKEQPNILLKTIAHFIDTRSL